MKIRTQLKSQSGSALIAVLIVLFILLTVFFAIFGLGISRTALLRKKIDITRSEYLAHAGIQRFLYLINETNKDWRFASSLDTLVEISGSESFSIQTELMGGYIKVLSKGKANNQTKSIQALVGLLPNKDFNSAVINRSIDYPLVVCGYTHIIGDAIVGPRGITKGSIEGQGFIREKLAEGTITSRVPTDNTIDNEPLRYFIEDINHKKNNPTRTYSGSKLISDIPINKDGKQTILTIEGNVEIDSLSYNNPDHDLYIFAGGNISITNHSNINGPITIMSDKSITVGMQSQLCNAVLVANDTVHIMGNSIFNGQIICGGKIVIKDSSKVEYPSLLYVHNLDDNNTGKAISLMDASRIDAVTIMGLENSIKSEDLNKIYIDTLVVASGIVWSSEFSDIRGKINGTSITKSYWFELKPTTYYNWLKNVTIDRRNLDFLPILPITVEQENKYAVFNIQD
jgi:hypothetical protein